MSAPRRKRGIAPGELADPKTRARPSQTPESKDEPPPVNQSVRAESKDEPRLPIDQSVRPESKDEPRLPVDQSVRPESHGSAAPAVRQPEPGEPGEPQPVAVPVMDAASGQPELDLPRNL